MAINHFLSLADISKDTLTSILAQAHDLKAARRGIPHGKVDPKPVLDGHTLAMIFEKSSTRTRFSFDMAMRQLGGSSITATHTDMQLGRGETVEDTARVLSRFVDAIMLRANAHDTLCRLADAASIPVINGLTDYNHPCQIMADLMTLEEKGGQLSDMCLTWVGDGNNVAMSFVNAASKFGYMLRLCTPDAYALPAREIERARHAGSRIELISDPVMAAKDADVIIADTFVSMGDKDAEQRLKELMPYQVNSAIMNAAKPSALFLHCLPAHREEEVSSEVIDGPQSVVFDEAENRLHAQKAILAWCLSGV